MRLLLFERYPAYPIEVKMLRAHALFLIMFVLVLPSHAGDSEPDADVAKQQLGTWSDGRTDQKERRGGDVRWYLHRGGSKSAATGQRHDTT